jgi:hypothetical protein
MFGEESGRGCVAKKTRATAAIKRFAQLAFMAID